MSGGPRHRLFTAVTGDSEMGHPLALNEEEIAGSEGERRTGGEIQHAPTQRRIIRARQPPTSKATRPKTDDMIRDTQASQKAMLQLVREGHNNMQKQQLEEQQKTSAKNTAVTTFFRLMLKDISSSSR